jgi:hypothetical protein
MPAHRAVLERDDLVGQAGVDQRLRADDRPGAAGAVHHHQRLGVRGEVLHAIDQLGAGAVDAARDRHVVELGHRPRIEDHQVGLGIDQLLQVGGIDARRVVLVLHDLAERLARHVDAGEDLVARITPGFQAAFHDGEIGVAELRELGGGAVSAAGPLRILGIIAAVHQHDAGTWIGQQRQRPRLQPRERKRRGEQRMALRRELAFLPHVEEGEDLARLQHGLDLLHRENRRQDLGLGHEALGGAGRQVDGHAVGELFQAQPVEMEVQGVA